MRSGPRGLVARPGRSVPRDQAELGKVVGDRESSGFSSYHPVVRVYNITIMSVEFFQVYPQPRV